MNLLELGMDPATGTIGASRLGDVAGPDRSPKEPEGQPQRKCAYVITDEKGHIVGRCGTTLRKGNRGCFCTLHAELRVKGEKYVQSLEARRRLLPRLVPIPPSQREG